VRKEWTAFQKDLPPGVFVRAFEDRCDLLQLLVLGSSATPYFLGVFCFDIYLPADYPNRPPQLHYLSYGHRLNPNLYAEGKVCLSLLGTWAGKSTQQWDPKASNLMQVFLSLQGLVLGQAEPYFLEAGYEKQKGTASGHRASVLYNEQALILSMKLMRAVYARPPPGPLSLIVKAHLRSAVPALKRLQACPIPMHDGSSAGGTVKANGKDKDKGKDSSDEESKDEALGEEGEKTADTDTDKDQACLELFGLRLKHAADRPSLGFAGTFVDLLGHVVTELEVEVNVE
jgi:ubiquitin-protein ligase